MKNMIIILTIFSLFTGCSQEESKVQLDPIDPNFIYGTWQFVETYDVFYTPYPHWVSVENGYTYEFKLNGTFESNKYYNDYLTGKFSITNSTITLIYDCPTFNNCDGITSECIEKYRIENEFLVLSPTYRNCDEGCENRFKKIAEPKDPTNFIYGTWQLVEYFCASDDWDSVEDGYTYEFKLNGTFESNRNNDCLTGKFSITNSTITLIYDCDTFNNCDGITSDCIEKYRIENEFLYLSPKDRNCGQGCENRFKKIAEPKELLDSIHGTWQMVEASDSFEPDFWSSVEDGDTYEFKLNGTFFESNRNNDCFTGKFSITNSTITFFYFDCEPFNCDGNTSECIEKYGGKYEYEFEYDYYIENEFLYLSPNYLSCDEGCLYRFRKIA